MDSPSLFLSSYPLFNKNHPKTQKFPTFKASSLLSNHHTPHSSPQSSTSSPQPCKNISFSTLQTHSPSSLQNLLFPQNLLSKSCFSLTVIDLFASLPSLADEAAASSPLVESDAGKINLEEILVSIDNFFNRYPFFVAGVTFIWLVVIPIAQEYFRKYKFVSAIDAFRKLRDDPDSQLLDIRDRKNVKFLGSPNLKLLNKEAVKVEFTEGNEDGFVKKVLGRFKEPPNTVLCVLDSFDGNSLKAAELLFKNGFKEVYAIRGGVRGQQGWMAIQDSLLPPSVHIKRRKKKKASQEVGANGNGAIQQNDSNYESASTPDIPADGNQEKENGHVKRSEESVPERKISSVVSSSPYPNYPDLKPPSSPTPSKPQ
ncbi:rhodanese-like domain-containing protein 4A, chloroplastic [Arachis duranensis]|uniref:Rhodanese-like domain-containing protein 4A, chloroplastic n=1 Tax=Arachis duranensis TaxID=130453 RepID=A0A9C6TKW5_ARADU|nr:rhodanese-like domain-containing protein 4A, chloroplastic [Arachis duranensis]